MDIDEADVDIVDALALVEEVKPVLFPKLAGKGSVVQSIVLIDLLAIWLAGHIVPGDLEETRKLRSGLLAAALTTVGELVRLEDEKRGTFK